MVGAFGVKAPLNYSVFAAAAGGMLLGRIYLKAGKEEGEPTSKGIIR